MRDLLKRVGTNIRALRQARKLSQEEFALTCGLHRTYIGSVERGERNVSLENLARIAIALGVELPELVRGVECAAMATDRRSQPRATE
jgi:transcriptional regulator with XRE-family HTH domain